MLQILCLLISAQALSIKRGFSPSAGQQLIDFAKSGSSGSDEAMSIFVEENSSWIPAISTKAEFYAPVPKDNDIELFYRINVFS